jgi:hypothetical protein
MPEVNSLSQFGELLESSALVRLEVTVRESTLLREKFDRSTAQAAFALEAERKGYEVVSSQQSGRTPWHDSGAPGSRRLTLELRRRSPQSLVATAAPTQSDSDAIDGTQADTGGEGSNVHPALRFDGVYVHREGDEFGGRHYQRFYPSDGREGRVYHARAASGVTDAQASSWLCPTGNAEESKWRSHGTQISFAERWSGGAVEFQGQIIDGGMLRMSAASETAGRGFTDRVYEFLSDSALETDALPRLPVVPQETQSRVPDPRPGVPSETNLIYAHTVWTLEGVRAALEPIGRELLGLASSFADVSAAPVSPKRGIFSRSNRPRGWRDCVWWYDRNGQRLPGLAIPSDGGLAEPIAEDAGTRFTPLTALDAGIYLAAEDPAPGLLSEWRATLRRWEAVPEATLEQIGGRYLCPPNIAHENLERVRANLATLDAATLAPI